MSDDTPSPPVRRPARVPALLLGIGLGGFVDGIVLHQLLQWHHLLTATGDHPVDTVRGLEQNTVADGLFHVLAWLFVVVGTSLAVRAWQLGRLAPPWRVHAGVVLIGWGAFNLVEGVVNHHLLTIHHVRDDVADPAVWDVGFLLVGAIQVIVGAALTNFGNPRVRPFLPWVRRARLPMIDRGGTE